MIYHNHLVANAQEGALSNDPEPRVRGGVAHLGAQDNRVGTYPEEVALVPPALTQNQTNHTG
jgi:hypothetical protein